jgi:hypothetical protein
MKNLKLLNKNFLSILSLLITLLFTNNLLAENEPIDIWDLQENNENNEKEIIESENLDLNTDSSLNFKIDDKNLEIIKNSNIEPSINLAGLFDPSDNGLPIDMWINSDGADIIRIFKRINKMKLSNDSDKIIKIALLTNSYNPNKNISEDEFINFKIDYLIKNKDLELIKSYLVKNQNALNNSKLIKYYVETYLSESDLQKACEIFNETNILDDDYLIKFKIYCLINSEKREEAKVLFDLMKENNFKDIS